MIKLSIHTILVWNFTWSVIFIPRWVEWKTIVGKQSYIQYIYGMPPICRNHAIYNLNPSSMSVSIMHV